MKLPSLPHSATISRTSTTSRIRHPFPKPGYSIRKMTQPTFSSNYSPEEGLKDLAPLLKGSGQGGKWSLIPSGKGIERRFQFKGFKKTWVSL